MSLWYIICSADEISKIQINEIEFPLVDVGILL